MQKIQYLVHSYSEPNTPSLVHGYTSTESEAKEQLQVVARQAFKDATKAHFGLNSLATSDVQILGYEHYLPLANCTDPHGTYFLAGHCLVFADEEQTTIELIKWSVETKWRYFRYVTTEGPALVRVFNVLNGNQQSGLSITLPVAAPEETNFTIPPPPPPPSTLTQDDSNAASPLPSRPGQPLTNELLAKVAARRNFLENSRIELPVANETPIEVTH